MSIEEFAVEAGTWTRTRSKKIRCVFCDHTTCDLKLTLKHTWGAHASCLGVTRRSSKGGGLTTAGLSRALAGYTPHLG